MKVLVVGSGGREHALAWTLARSSGVTNVYVAPGNAGTALEPHVENVAIAAEDTDALLKFARESGVALTVIGPEAPLVAGIVDQFQAAGLRCFGPTAKAARLEGSKAYCKDFLKRYGIPTADYQTFTELEPAMAFAEGLGFPVVVKASGLAAGKGVVIAHSRDEAHAALVAMLEERRFGDAGGKVVVEAFLQGEEASYIVLAAGEAYVPLASSQDHKARDDGDRGPNTGGMGAYSPAPVVNDAMDARIRSQVIEPTLRGLTVDGNPFTGFLYAGLMISPNGDLRVLEFNVRFGDPETQPVLMRLRSSLAAALTRATEGDLNDLKLDWDPRPCLGVVMAAGGYPESYAKGRAISGLDDPPADDVKVFHAGTKLDGGRVITSGGRVLCVCALGDTLADAYESAYRAVGSIQWQDEYHRTDIGHRALSGG